MKNLKNHPVFTVIIALLLCAFAAGAVYDFMLYKKSDDAAKETRQIVNKYEAAINAAPTDEILQNAKKNVDDLRKKRDELYNSLSPDSSKIIKVDTQKTAVDLRENLRELASKWAAQAAEKGIVIPADYKFSFEGHISNKIKLSKESFDDLWTQAMILDNILQKLYKSKPENAPMSLISVQREPIAEEAKAANSKNSASKKSRRGSAREVSSSETFTVDQHISAKKDGSVSTQGFRIVFTGYTENMRRFLNELNKFDLMLVVRSVEVDPFTQGVEKPKRRIEPADNAEPSEADFGGAVAAAETEEIARDPVVSENVSKFTFVIEYVEVDKDFKAKSPEKSDGGDDSEEKAEE